MATIAVTALSELDNSALADCQPPVHRRRQPLVMRHDQGRSTGAPDNLLEVAEHLGGGLRIKVPSRLVGQQDARRVGHRAGDGYTLLLAARHGAGTVLPAVCKSDHAEKLFGPRFRLAAAKAIQHLRDHDILDCRKFGKKAVELEHETDMPGPQAPAPPTA